MESDTPETDKAAYEATTRTVGKCIVPLAKAQQLECERNEAIAQRDALKNALIEMRYGHTDKAESMAMAALQSLEKNVK